MKITGLKACIFFVKIIDNYNVSVRGPCIHTQLGPCICLNVKGNISTLQAVAWREGLAACSLSSFTDCEVESEVSGVFFFLPPASPLSPFLSLSLILCLSVFSLRVCLYSGRAPAFQAPLWAPDKKQKADIYIPELATVDTHSQTVNRSHIM